MIYPPLWSSKVEADLRDAAKNLDKQDRHPGPVQMCTRCVMTNQRPRITFNDEGVCSACQYADRKRSGIPWDVRMLELHDLLDQYRDPNRFDVIVPCSGGKDSAFAAGTLKHEFDMQPLCATWAPHMYTDIGWKNLQSFIHSGFDVVTAQPNGLVHRKLARLGLEFYGDPFLPFIYGQLAWPMRVAIQSNVELVFYGENGEAEYGGDQSANDKPCWDEDDWERVYMKGAGVRDLARLGNEIGCLTYMEFEELSELYEMPDTSHFAQFHWLGYYLPWHPQANYYYACENTGFEPNDVRSEGTYSKYASIDDKLDGLHYYMAYVKFGIGRCTSDAAHEVRDGDLSRDEALQLVAQYDGEFPKRHWLESCDYLGLRDDDWEWWNKIEGRFRGC